MRRLPRILLLTVFIPLAVALTVVLSLQVQAQSPTVYRVFLPATGSAMPERLSAHQQASLVVTPGALDFGVVDVNGAVTATLALSNTGNADIVIQRLAFAPLTSTSFSYTSSFTTPLTLTAGSRAIVSVTFMPHVAGAHRGTLNIVTNDPRQPLVAVSLRGFGGQGPPVDKPRERFEHYLSIRATPAYTVPGALRQRAWDQLQTLRPGFVPPVPGPRKATVDQTFRWVSIGPRNVGTTGAGRVISIAIDQSGTIYAGSALGGVYKSSDGASTWRSLMTHQPSLAMGALGIDPTDRLRVYAGTGEQNFALDSYYGAGVLRAADGGELGDSSWTQVGRTPFVFASGGGATFAKLIVNPRNAAELFAATSLGFYRSTDRGDGWTLITAGIPGQTVTDLVMDASTNPVTLYAAVSGAGVYRSTDGGLNWGLRSTGIPGANLGRITLALAPSNSQVLYASIENSSNNNLLGVYRTDDGGANWASIGAPDFCGNQCWYDNVVGVDPTNPNRVFLGGIGAQFATGAGNPLAWVFSNVNGLHADQHAIAWDPNNSTIVYVGNDGGLYRSTDSGANFTRLDIGAITQHQGFMVHPVLPDWAVAGSQDNGSMYYTGDRVNWQAAAGCDGGNSAVSQALVAPNEVYITTQSSGCSRIARADTITGAFNQKTTGITIGGNGRPDGNALFYPPLEIDPNNPNTLYYASNFVYRTTDRGDNWSYLPAAPGQQSLNGRVSTIAVAPSDSTTLYAGTDSGRVWRMTSASTNWVEANDFAAACGPGATCLPQRFVTRVTARPGVPTTVYVTFGGFAAGGGRPGHVFRSVDSGVTWTDITPRDYFNNRIDLPVNTIVIDPNLPDRLFIGTDIGVLYSDNNGGAWQFLDVGMPDVAIYNMDIHPGTGKVRAATHGRSTYELEVAGPRLNVEKRLVSPVSGVARVGDAVVYSIRISNTGTTNITSLPLDDIFDGRYLSYVSASPLPTAVGPNLVEWADLTGLPPFGIGRSLRPNEAITIMVTFQVIGCPTPAAIPNKAKVSGAIDENRDPVPTFEAVAGLTIACPAVAVSKRLTNPDPCAIFGPGDSIQFTVTITNTGNTNLVTIPLVDTYDPAYLQFSSATPTPNSTAPPGTLTWNDLTGPAPNGFALNLAPGQVFNVAVAFTALQSTSGLANGVTVNRVRVQGATDEYGFVAPTASGGADVAIRSADLYVEKTQLTEYPRVQVRDNVANTLGMSPFGPRLSNAVVMAGEIITYNVKYGNRGPDEAAFVRIVDTIPAGAVYLGHNLAPCLDRDIRTACYVGRVAPGEKREFQVWIRMPLPSEPGFSTPPGTLLVNRVTIDSGFTEAGPACGTPDALPGDNTVTYNTTVLGEYGDAPSAAVGGDLPGYGAQVTGAYGANYAHEWLGRAVSGERSASDAADPDSEPNLGPFNTDHHDDGVFYRNPFAFGLPSSQRTYLPAEWAVTARVTVSVADPSAGRYTMAPGNKLYVRSWADSNRNGVFGDAGDTIMFDWQGGPGLVGSDLTLWPAGQSYHIMDLRIQAPGETGWMMVRTRLSYGTPPTPGGVMDFGEIEDNLIGVFLGTAPPGIPGPTQPRPPAP